MCEAGVDRIQWDVMDGVFVPNLTFGPDVIAAAKPHSTVEFEAHLMVVNPDELLPRYVGAGCELLIVHAEACTHLHRTLGHIRQLGARAGVAINPSTPVGALAEVVDQFDHVLVMSVNPGFTGQSFIPRSVAKVAAVRSLLDTAGTRADIEVDGGVDAGNAAALVGAGATILVAGAAIFRSGDPVAATRALREAAASPR